MNTRIHDTTSYLFGAAILTLAVYTMAVMATIIITDVLQPKTSNIACTCTYDTNCPIHGKTK